MPLLIYLGRCLSDGIPTDIFQPHRKIANPKEMWTWPSRENHDIKFQTNCLKRGNGRNAVLLLSISDEITKERYANILDSDSSIYEITVEDPDPRIIQSREHLEGFAQIYRQTINEIHQTHVPDCIIHLVPAVPPSVAVQCGRETLSKDPHIWIYEYFSDSNYCQKVIEL